MHKLIAGLGMLGASALASKKRKAASKRAILMYRGARHGDPRVLTGPSYFITSELFAKTYGKTAAFNVDLGRKKVISQEEWTNTYGNPLGLRSQSELIRELEQEGYDSVFSDFGPFTVAFVLDPHRATLVSE